MDSDQHTPEKITGNGAASHRPLDAGDGSRTKLLLIDCPDEEEVRRHVDLLPFLNQGWCIKSATPRIVEAGETKMLVVLTGGDVSVPVAAPPDGLPPGSLPTPDDEQPL